MLVSSSFWAFVGHFQPPPFDVFECLDNSELVLNDNTRLDPITINQLHSFILSWLVEYSIVHMFPISFISCRVHEHSLNGTELLSFVINWAVIFNVSALDSQWKQRRVEQCWRLVINRSSSEKCLQTLATLLTSMLSKCEPVSGQSSGDNKQQSKKKSKKSNYGPLDYLFFFSWRMQKNLWKYELAEKEGWRMRHQCLIWVNKPRESQRIHKNPTDQKSCDCFGPGAFITSLVAGPEWVASASFWCHWSLMKRQQKLEIRSDPLLSPLPSNNNKFLHTIPLCTAPQTWQLCQLKVWISCKNSFAPVPLKWPKYHRITAMWKPTEWPLTDSQSIRYQIRSKSISRLISSGRPKWAPNYYQIKQLGCWEEQNAHLLLVY